METVTTICGGYPVVTILISGHSAHCRYTRNVKLSIHATYRKLRARLTRFDDPVGINIVAFLAIERAKPYVHNARVYRRQIYALSKREKTVFAFFTKQPAR